MHILLFHNSSSSFRNFLYTKRPAEGLTFVNRGTNVKENIDVDNWCQQEKIPTMEKVKKQKVRIKNKNIEFRMVEYNTINLYKVLI